MKMIKPAVTAVCLLAASGAQAGGGNPLQGLDYDGDGTVTLDGAIAARMENFLKADTDRDGALNTAEHKAMMDAVREKYGIPETEPERGQVDPFTFADSNADGLVTVEEFNAISEKILRSLDKDGDGVIDLEAAATGDGSSPVLRRCPVQAPFQRPSPRGLGQNRRGQHQQCQFGKRAGGPDTCFAKGCRQRKCQRQAEQVGF